MLFDSQLSADQQQQELAAICAPISGDSAVGIDPNATPEARAQVRALEDQLGECFAAEKRNLKKEGFNLPPEPVSWEPAVDKALKYIAGTSKNLVLATLVTEAGLRIQKARGFALGLELMTELIDKYWPQVHPVGPISANNGASDIDSKKFAALRYAYDWPERVAKRLDTLMALTPGGTRVSDYYDALKLNDPGLDSSIRQKRIEKGVKTVEQIQVEFQQHAPQVKLLYENLMRCSAATDKLKAAMDSKCASPDPTSPFYLPDLSSTAEGIRRIAGIVRKLAPADLIVDPEPPATQAAEGASDAPRQFVVPGGQMTRENAFAQLTQLAAFFRQTEPHSPISYAIEQTVRWGKMSLPELLTELVANEDTRKAMFERAGLPRDSLSK